MEQGSGCALAGLGSGSKGCRSQSGALGRGANAVERTAGRDVQRLQVVAAEGTVGHLVPRHRQEGEQAALGAEDVDAALLVRGRLERRVRLGQARRHVEPALLVLLDAVRTATRVPVVEQFATLQSDGAVLVQVEPPQLAGAAAGVVVVVWEVEKTVIGRNVGAVG